MKVSTGRICEFLHDPMGQINALSLADGSRFCFPPDRAKRVLEVAMAGSLIEVHAFIRRGDAGEAFMDAAVIVNLRSGKFADLRAPTSPDNPEVPADQYLPHGTAAPLDPSLEAGFERPVIAHSGVQPLATPRTAADEIDQAHDGLHRTEAMLAHLKMIKREPSGIGEYLDEAKHTYLQALCQYQARDFEAARELAAASVGLSEVVQILISRTQRSDAEANSDLRSGLEMGSPGLPAPEAAEHDLDQVCCLLARVHWVTMNGTLASEDLAQIQKLIAWCETLHGWARQLLDLGDLKEAFEFARASHAAACAAEHLCKKCYVTRVADSPLASWVQ